MNTRRLRVSYRQPDARGTLAPLRLPPSMPFLRLQGRWLEHAGFTIGADVRVKVRPRRLVLEVIDAEHRAQHDLEPTGQHIAD